MTTSGQTSGQTQRFVPEGEASLIDDAPGWEEQNDGPICWKCKGSGTGKGKKPRISKTGEDEENQPSRTCPVCQGRGSLHKRRVPDKPGLITRGRRRPAAWHPEGPDPAAMSLNDEYSRMVERANSEPADVEVDNLQQGPEWLPRTSEELCNLVGNWRILQRVGSHRWTTDDLVTAWVASLHYDKCLTSINYLDLGTGNASVLQMTVWAMLKQGKKVKAMGVEARSEAVALALRSLQFNLGSPQEIVQIVHSDFRSLAVDKTFDLITGTPPYFSVDFNVKEGKVTKAIINQGGMPTAKQSAPARCEFRGGIEAYCEVASKCLRRVSGRFVFCANWLNHDRVISAAASFGLTVVMQLEVKGRQQKGNLFCVYVMALEPVYHHSTVPVEQLAVRTLNGDWTRDYKERVMSSMSIPFE